MECLSFPLTILTNDVELQRCEHHTYEVKKDQTKESARSLILSRVFYVREAAVHTSWGESFFI